MDAVELLVEAGAALAGSLDPQDDDARGREADRAAAGRYLRDRPARRAGPINDVAVVAADEQIARGLEALREHSPLDPDGEHPVARVIRSGQPELLAEMGGTSLRTSPRTPPDARVHDRQQLPLAIVVAPTGAGRTLGAIFDPATRAEQAARTGGAHLSTRRTWSSPAARAACRAGDRQRASVLRPAPSRAAAGGDPDRRRGCDHCRGPPRADGLRQPGRGGSLEGGSSPSELTSTRAGLDHATFPRSRRAGEWSSDRADARADDCSPGSIQHPQLVRNIVRATGEERWMVARASPVADPDTESCSTWSTSSRTSPRSSARSWPERLLYNERRRIAHILQRALLPEYLAQIPGVEIETLDWPPES